MPDPGLTRLTAVAMSDRLRAGDLSSRELVDAHLARAERENPALNAWLVIDGAGARAAADEADARLARARVDGAGDACRAAPAVRGAGRPQGSRLGARRPVHGGLAHPRRVRLAVRRPHHRAAARRRGGDPGQAQHGRVRDGVVHGALGLRSDREPVGPGPGAGRQLGGIGRQRRGRPRPAQHRDGHRRLRPPAGRDDRRGGHEADVRAGQPLRDRRLRLVAGPGRAVRAHRARRRDAAPRSRRS